jgi:hypothetical protein
VNIAPGVGGNDDVVCAIGLVLAAGLGALDAGRNEVSIGVMVKSLGVLDIDLFPLRRLAGPVVNEGDGGREIAALAWFCCGVAEADTEPAELRLAACGSRLGDASNGGPVPTLCAGKSSRGLSIAACGPSEVLATGFGLVVL